MQDVVVIIPTFNEIENISKMLETVMSLPVRFDVLVVDDNSPTGRLLLCAMRCGCIRSAYSLKNAEGSSVTGTAYIHGFQVGVGARI